MHSDNTGTDEQRVLLGVVGVDSGQLMVIDPCYIDGEWRRSGESEATAIQFWGQDQARVRNRLRGNPAIGAVRKVGSVYRATPAEGRTLGDVAEAVERATGPDDVVVMSQHTTSSYDEVGDVSHRLTEHGGQLNYKMGHPGLAVAFSPGFGDGVYEVWAVTYDYEGWGRRVAKVEILMIVDACPFCDDDGWLIEDVGYGPAIVACAFCETMTDREAARNPDARRALVEERDARERSTQMAQRVAAAMTAHMQRKAGV